MRRHDYSPIVVTCKADPSIQRITRGNFQFPLGSYPVEDLTPRQGFSVNFEPADGDDSEGEWEEWPDRYVYDVVISAERVEPLCRMLFSLLQGRVFPILDVLGHDAYREIDPYISYDLVGLDRFTDAVRRFRDFLYEDGMCGFGAMSEEPFFYIFIDEHKIITLRCEPGIKEKVEKILAAFDLEAVDEPAGADAAAHEHRGVLSVPNDNADLLSPEEIVERLKEEWQLLLNVDPDTNLDDEGNELGIVPWRVIIRCEYDTQAPRYAEVLLDAGTLREAEEMAFDSVDELLGDVPMKFGFGEGEKDDLGIAPWDLPEGLREISDEEDGGAGGAGPRGIQENDRPRKTTDRPAGGKRSSDKPPTLPPGQASKSGGVGGAEGTSPEADTTEPTWEDSVIVAADRVTADIMKELLIAAQVPPEKAVKTKGGGKPRVRSSRWVQ